MTSFDATARLSRLAEGSMFDRAALLKLCGLIVSALLVTTATRADSLVLVTSQAAQGANDSVHWAQLGADATSLGSSSTVKSSVGGSSVTLTLSGIGSLVSVVCPATPCSWNGSSSGFPATDSLIWTSDTGNGGNGPVTLTFTSGVSGVGAMIQADGPGQFTAQIQVFNGATSLGSFTVTSDTNGDAAYIGVQDQSGSNITSVVFSLTTCTVGTCTDFAIDTVNLNSAPATVISLISSVNPSALGQAVTFTATVKPATGSGTPTGTVTFNDGSTTLGTGTLSGGSATFMTSGLAGGAHSITAVYGGDTNFSGGTSPILTQTVNKAASSTSVSSSNNPSNRGASVIFTATVTSSAAPTPTGVVTFQDGGSTLGTAALSGSTATFTTAALLTGPHTITATYGGDANFASSTSTSLTQTVGKAVSSTSVASSNNPSTLAASVTFTATVTSPITGIPTGTVTFQDGGSTLGMGTLSSGTATFTTSALAGGARSITAVYSGDANFAASTSPPLTQTVNRPASSTSVVSSNSLSMIGTAVTFTATVTSVSGTPTGVVTFQDGASTLGTGTLSGGKAAFTTSVLVGGAHSITAAYGGDANFASSTSSVLTETIADFSVAAAPPATATVAAGSNGIFTINLTTTGGPTQSVTMFSASGNPTDTTVAFSTQSMPAGTTTSSTMMTITTVRRSSGWPAARPFPALPGPAPLVYSILCLMLGSALLSLKRKWLKGRKLIGVCCLGLVLLACAAFQGCANTQVTGGNGTPGGTPAGTSTITVTASEGSISRTTTVSLTVQ